jgi:diguanylate cyclase (GGDEF)-like protein/PAS domain S-box-containing protein
MSGTIAYVATERFIRLNSNNRQLHQHRRAIDSSANALVITNPKGIVVWANPAYAELTGYDLDEIIGRRCGETVRSGQHAPLFYQQLWETISTGNVWHGEIINRHKDGRLYHDETTITPILDENNKVEGYVTVKRDVSMRKLAEAEVEQLAYFDSLTGLPNRRLLRDRLGHAISASKRSECYGALMFLDLDDFKPLNDTLGHDIGDLLLIQVACRITDCLREEDTVARFGGDEFIVLLSQLDQELESSVEHARIVGEKILAVLSKPYHLQSLRQTDVHDHIEHRCSASIGVRMFRGNDLTPDALLREADQAMYRSKLQGRGCLSFHLP